MKRPAQDSTPAAGPRVPLAPRSSNTEVLEQRNATRRAATEKENLAEVIGEGRDAEVLADALEAADMVDKLFETKAFWLRRAKQVTYPVQYLPLLTYLPLLITYLYLPPSEQGAGRHHQRALGPSPLCAAEARLLTLGASHGWLARRPLVRHRQG